MKEDDMTLQTWGTPETGVYYLRHAGRDLEVRRIPNIRATDKKKSYQVFIDGILADLSWTVKDAKSKAIKIAERTHRGQRVQQLVNGKTLAPSEQVNGSIGEKDASSLGNTSNLTDRQREELADLINAPLPCFSESLPAVNEPAPVPAPDPVTDTLSFQMTGRVKEKSSRVAALSALEVVVDLLREHWEVGAETSNLGRMKF